MWRNLRMVCNVLLLALIVLSGVPAHAQSYSFNVTELRLQVFVQPDASARLVYDITFENYGDPIDIVDVGLPHKGYNLSQITASLDGHRLTDIRKSTYIDIGVEVHLGVRTISRGQSGTLHLEATLPAMVYQDTTDKDLASLQIVSTWYDSDLVRGTGAVLIQVILPEGLAAETVLYQDVPFSDKRLESGQVVVEWQYTDVSITRPYRVGVSFPKTVMTRVETMTFWKLAGQWLEGVFGFLAGCAPLAFILLFLGGMVWSAIKGSKPNYLPPIAEVEGGGIKRGLTAPEAAAILELPLNKVLLLVMFGMLEKGLVRVVEANPLLLEVEEAFQVMNKQPVKNDPVARREYRREVARQRGTVIHGYEDPFLDLLEEHSGKPVEKLPVVNAMKTLVKGVAKKMQGFSLAQTREYYERVIARAMEQAANLGDLNAREEYLDQYMPWVMMNRNYRPVVTVGDYHYWPRWARASTTSVGGGKGVASAARGAAGRGHAPQFRDVAGSFAGWSEKAMGGMAAAIMPTALQKPAPPSTSSSSGGSSCACACAGCACACACAGGGR